MLCLYCNGTACETIPDLVEDSDFVDEVGGVFDSLEWVLEETRDEQDSKDSEHSEPRTSCRKKRHETRM